MVVCWTFYFLLGRLHVLAAFVVADAESIQTSNEISINRTTPTRVFRQLNVLLAYFLLSIEYCFLHSPALHLQFVLMAV